MPLLGFMTILCFCSFIYEALCTAVQYASNSIIKCSRMKQQIFRQSELKNGTLYEGEKWLVMLCSQ